MSILVINAGSSSVKLGLFGFDTLTPLARGLLDWAGTGRRAALTLEPHEGDPIRRDLDVSDYRTGVEKALEILGRTEALAGGVAGIRVVGHRLIHGGEEIREPVRIDAEVKKTIQRYAHLAPLHIPPGLEAIEATESALLGVPQVGLFDTAFFAHIPACAYLYPVPYAWYEEWGIRRFGFHGTSHAYCTARAAEMLDREGGKSRLVICHLGQGSSATAVRDGVAVTNTMGFTPLEGFMMGTRSGTIDPGILLYVQREHGLGVDELDEILHKKSGLLGISGLSSDFREVEAAAQDGHRRARLALDVYAYRVRAMIGALAVTLGGIDALVFTGGIGEHAPEVRARVCQGADWLGLAFDEASNAAGGPRLSTPDSRMDAWVVPTNEELVIARHCQALLV